MKARAHHDSLGTRDKDARRPRPDVSRLAAEARRGVAEHDDTGLAAELAFRAALTLLPFLLLLAALPSVIGSVFAIPDISARIADQAETLLSKNSAAVVNTLVGEVTRSQGWTAVGIGLFGTLFSGLTAMTSIRKALNRIYGFDESETLFTRKLIELGLTVVVGLLMFLAALCVVLAPLILDLPYAIDEALSLAAAMLCLLTAVSLVYWLAPSSENTLRWITPGAVLFGVVWLVFSLGFSVYLSQFGTLNRVYGSLGVMIVLLVWLYGSSIALLAGAELNAILGRRYDDAVRADVTAPSPL